ncbi:glycosyltransferase family 4 protein [Prosthecobacter sp.]|uniref:glycosyltransferase family 4 protein n=1 Tax=Prosthecobacter sp. TaxID=1965333 RepID=UPI001D4C8103|nr:glycosyltransferase family 4 protein [Prosthecobacter sp.]MCB1276972.1 glycosyltransferase family 4 protein [Prosthecobacter sp.]
MTNRSVLLAHPGTQYAPHLARELVRHGLLHRFWTGFAVAGSGWLGGLLRYAPGSIRRRLGKRLVDVPDTTLRTLPLLDWRARKAARFVGDEAAFFERNRLFQEAIPVPEIRAAGVVIGFDTSSWLLARRAKEMGKRFILDQSIGHPSAKERIFSDLRQRFPQWSTSAPLKAAEMVATEREEHELADIIVVPSQFVKETLVVEGVDERKIRVIPFGTNLELFQPGPPRRQEACPLVFLFVGSVSARKGTPVLLQAWRQWNPDNAELWLVGPGAIPTEEQSGLPSSVKVLGPRGRAEVAALMQKADVFVFPSFFEGLAQVQIEAQACGLPLIATRESGADELVDDGRTGCLVPAGDVGALEAAMRRFAEDGGLRLSMREQAIAGRERLSWMRYGDQWARLLKEVL